jgi:hypothetical protein
MIITVSGKFIKQTFIDLNPILSKSDMAKSIAFTVQDNRLYITSSAIFPMYQSFVEIKDSVDYVSMSATVLYSRIEDFISSREDVHLEFTKVSVNLYTEDFEKPFVLSDSVITLIDIEETRGVEFDFPSLAHSIEKLASTSILQKTLQVDKPFLFFGSYALLKFSTVWIKIRSAGVYSSISKEHAKCISNFEPKTILDGDIIHFYKDNATLLVPKNAIEDDKTFEELVNSLTVITQFNVDGIFGILQKITRAAGFGECRCYVYQNGIELQKITQSSSLTKKINCEGEQLAAFTLPIEYILMSFNLLKDGQAEILVGDGKVCLRNNQVSILLSAV